MTDVRNFHVNWMNSLFLYTQTPFTCENMNNIIFCIYLWRILNSEYSKDISLILAISKFTIPDIKVLSNEIKPSQVRIFFYVSVIKDYNSLLMPCLINLICLWTGKKYPDIRFINKLLNGFIFFFVVVYFFRDFSLTVL